MNPHTGHGRTEKSTGAWNPLRLIRAARRRFHLFRTDLSGVERFVVFVGNPRSGTTLVRSLLNAHPSVVIANEVHALRCVAVGENWNTVLGRILDNERQFAANPVWTGYRYEVPRSVNEPKNGIRVIGDKKAGGTSKLLQEDPSLVLRLQEWSPLPVQYIHCVRHPFDVTSTKSRRNGNSLAQNIDRYFAAEAAAISVQNSVGDAGYLRIHQEDLISDSAAVLHMLLHFIGLDTCDGYVRACQSVIYESPNKSRHGITWPAGAIIEVERRSKQVPHLQRYLTGDRLLFHEDTDQKNRATNRAAA